MQNIQLKLFSHLSGVKPEALTGNWVVVIDVLRATTTMLAALRSGCSRIIPCATIAAARQAAKKLTAGKEKFILAGERGGLPIPGFTAGNSPQEFTTAKNKTVILTTSNGTKALALAGRGSKSVIAGLNNISAVSNCLLKAKVRKLVILAAGEKGQEALEDTYTAGVLLQDLLARMSRLPKTHKCILDSGALRALGLAVQNRDAEKFLRQTHHGRELIKYGFGEDVSYAARVNSMQLVGCLTPDGIIPWRKS